MTTKINKQDIFAYRVHYRDEDGKVRQESRYNRSVERLKKSYEIMKNHGCPIIKVQVAHILTGKPMITVKGDDILDMTETENSIFI